MYNEMDGNFDDVAINTFKSSLPAEHGLRKSLTGKPATSVHQLMDQIDKYKRVEEGQMQGRGKEKVIPQERRDFRSDRYTNSRPRRDFAGQFRGHQKALLVEYQRRRRRTHPRTRLEDRLSPLLSAFDDPARPLMKPSQRPSSWACFSTKFIVLGLLGLGSLTSTIKAQTRTLQKVFEWNIFLFELWFDIYDFRQFDYILTLIHRIFISIVLLISSKRLLKIYCNTEYMIFFTYMLE